MTTTQRTPGPWTYTYAPYTTQDGKELPAFEIHGEGEKVCDTVEDQPIEAQEGNARLIAAAPDLLDALVKSEQRIVQLCDLVNTLSNKLALGNKVKTDDFADAARAAIAQVTT